LTTDEQFQHFVLEALLMQSQMNVAMLEQIQELSREITDLKLQLRSLGQERTNAIVSQRGQQTLFSLN
jgi:hypothetical protein